MTKVSYLKRKRRVNEAVAIATGYRTVDSGNVGTSGAKINLCRTVQHVSKSKKFCYARNVADKKH